MSIFLILDILLVLLILLFMPIGFWRGPVKEMLVTLGVLFGILLADYWARPWGGDLTVYTELTEGSGAFIVAMIFLVASTFILGYGLGAALGPAYHSTPARLIGAGIAALNGILLLSFSLQYVRLYLLSDANEESLDDSYVSRFLLDEVGWVLLLVAFIAVPLLLFILLSGRRAYEVIYDEFGYEEEYPEPIPTVHERARGARARGQTLPPRVPGRPDERDAAIYKTEPEPAPGRANAETRPLIVSRQRATAEPAPASTNPEGEAVEHDADREQPRDKFGDTDPHIVIPSPPQPAPGEVEAAEPEQREEDNLAPGYERCRTCHAVLAPGVSICPNCGTLR